MRAAIPRAATLARNYDPFDLITRSSYANNSVASICGVWHPDGKILNQCHAYNLSASYKNIFFGTFNVGKLSSHVLNEQRLCDSEATLDSGKEGDVAIEFNIEQRVQGELPVTDAKAFSAVPAVDLSREKMDTVSSSLFKALLNAPHSSVTAVLNEWTKAGNTLDRSAMSVAMIQLRKRRLYGKALQFLEWLESSKHVQFVERDYASHLDLVAKTKGLQAAASYINKVPDAFKGEVVYRTLLANCVTTANPEKAEQVFSKMRDLGLSISSFAYNQLLLLYRRVDRRKIPGVVLMMEKDNTQPSLFTFMILIDAMGLSKDTEGMEKILEKMKAEGIVKPDNALRALVARHYISTGFNEKAEAILKEIEDDCGRESSDAWRLLLPLYASLSKVDDVNRLWKSCEPKACVDDFTAAIEAYGKLGLVDDAEKILEKLTKKWGKIPPRSYNAMLKVYADHKLVSKGKDLVSKMSGAGCWIGPVTWDALVKLFVEAGEVERAESVLLNAVRRTGCRPLYSTYIFVLNKYAELGDVHNAEKMFRWLRQAKYRGRVHQYELLAKAYKNAKRPAYGLRERMKADNAYPVIRPSTTLGRPLEVAWAELVCKCYYSFLAKATFNLSMLTTKRRPQGDLKATTSLYADSHESITLCNWRFATLQGAKAYFTLRQKLFPGKLF